MPAFPIFTERRIIQRIHPDPCRRLLVILESEWVCMDMICTGLFLARMGGYIFQWAIGALIPEALMVNASTSRIGVESSDAFLTEAPWNFSMKD